MKKIRSAVVFLVGFFILLPLAVFSQTNQGWLLAYSHYHGGGYLGGCAVGDLDSDGLDDAVVTGYGEILVYLQNNGGSLDKPVVYTGAYNNGIDVGDVNNDGRDDVVVTYWYGMGVFYQNASGTLDPMVSHYINTWDEPGLEPRRIRIGDFNNDNLQDIIVANDGNFWVYYQQAGGGLSAFTQYANFMSNWDLEAADMNNDGRIDLAIGGGHGSGSNFGVHLQNAGGTFDALVLYTQTFPAAPTAFTVGDLNGDGLTDMAGSWDLNVNIFYQNAGGTFDAPVLLTQGSPDNFAALVFDIDRDGRNDLLISCNNGIRCFYQETDGTLGVRRELYYSPPNVGVLNPHCIDTGDLNNDGVLDIAYKSADEGLFVYWGWDNSPAIVFRDPTYTTYYTDHLLYIKWGTTGISGGVSIAYSINGGFTWNEIVNNTPNDGTLAWPLPYIDSDNYQLRVSSATAGVSGFSEIFTVEDDGTERIRVESPNGGEDLVADSPFEITWETTGPIQTVRIRYSTDNGTSWSDIVDGTENDGSYTWTVPDEVSDLCRIRVIDTADGTPTDDSDNVFSILEPGTEVITITSPNGGENLTGNSVHTITWNTAGNVASVALAYSTNNGTNWTNIATAPNTGSYDWAVPGINSSQCLVRVRDAADNIPSDVSDSTFTISTIVGPNITVLSPNGGERLYIGFTVTITWESTYDTVGNVQIQYSINNGSSWITIVSSTANDGSYDWVVPNTPSNQCLVRIREASDGNPSDVSDTVFTIDEFGATLSITSPQNKDLWQVGSKEDIKWVSGPAVSNNVKLEYSTDDQVTWKTIVSSTPNDGTYTWTVPNAPSDTCNVRISDAADGTPSNISYGHFSIVTGTPNPVISLNRTTLYYVWIKSSTAQTPMQVITIDNSGMGTMQWKAEVDEHDNDYDNESLWLKITNVGGTQSGQVGVYIEPMGLNTGMYDGSIKFTDDNATNSPQSVKVILNVYAPGSDSKPFGSFETPAHGSNVMSSIPVTGWVVDDVGIDEVTIWRNAVSGEGGGEVYVGDAVMVEGARPDVEAAYPTHPMSYQAGWGYMMLTNFLPNGGNGTYTLHAYAKDVGGNQVKLGSKTIVCNNANAVKPFGAIDAPPQGGEASGTKYRNQGWVLTPLPNKVPVDGSTIRVYVDGQNIGNCHYNVYRADIARLFPGYNNSNGAMAYFDFDTTAYANGIHTIQWVATDNGGNTDGIGSRYFAIQNTGYNRSASAAGSILHYNPAELSKIPVDTSRTIQVKTGYKEVLKPTALRVAKNGIIHIRVPQDERIVLDLKHPQAVSHAGYLEFKNQYRPLPPGASLDTGKGILYWQSGPASLGKYPLVFFSQDKSGKISKMKAIIEVVPKFGPDKE